MCQWFTTIKSVWWKKTYIMQKPVTTVLTYNHCDSDILYSQQNEFLADRQLQL